MKVIGFILFAFLNLTLLELAQGQSPRTLPQATGVLLGRVVDAATRDPLPSATVAVWRGDDSTLVSGSVTDAQGGFRMEGLPRGAYYVQVSHVGFNTRTIDSIDVGPERREWDLGVVELREDTRQLAEVEVASERPDVSFTADGTVYNTRNSMAAVGGSVTDLLREIPAVEVDIDGNVSLRGSQNVAIHINGKPAPMSGEFLTGYLQQLPAGSIDRVEVIPNPSARYDPDGMAGILNIVLKQNTELRGGGIMLGLGSSGQYNASLNGNYQKNKLSLFGNYGIRSDQRNGEGNAWREYRFETALPYMQQYTGQENRTLGHNVTGGVEYSFSSISTLSLNANASFFNRAADTFNDYLALDAGHVVLDPYRRSTEQENRGNHQSYSTVFRRTVEPSRNEFIAEVRFSQSASDNQNDWLYQVLSADRVPVGGDSLSFNRTESRNRDLIAQLDWSHPVDSLTKVDFGYKGLLRLIDNDYFETNAARDNAFDFNDQQQAVYGIATRTIGRFDVQLGLRLEYAGTSFELVNTGESFDNDYFSYFPSLNLSYRSEIGRQWRLSYAKRISRPEGMMLNPFVPSDDPLNVFSGNPYLKPNYTHSFEAGYQMFSGRGNFSFTPFYRRTVDAWTVIQRIGEDRVNRYTFENLNTNESYGIETNGGVRFGQRLNVSLGASVFKRVTDGTDLQAGLGVNTISWNFRANVQAEIRPGLRIEGFWMYRPRQRTEQGYWSSFTMTNLGLRQSLMGDKLNLSVRMTDPLKLMRFSNETDTDQMFSTFDREFDSRVFHVALQYNFGEQVQRRVRTRTETPSEADNPVGMPGMP